MAAPITVPQSHKPAIQELARLSDDAYAALFRCLTESSPSAEPNTFLEQTSKALEEHTRLGGQIVGALVGLRGVVDKMDGSIEAVAAGVVSDAETRQYVTPESADILKRRLTELLDTPSVSISAKAYSLLVADAAPFSDARIVTDVRPVFGGKQDVLEFTGSIVVHHLHIEVADDEDIYVALTTGDLLKLKKAVERALHKDKRLREALRTTPLAPLAASSLE